MECVGEVCKIETTDDGERLRLNLSYQEQNGGVAYNYLSAEFEPDGDEGQVFKVYLTREVGYLFPVVSDAADTQKRLLAAAAIDHIGNHHPLVDELCRVVGLNIPDENI